MTASLRALPVAALALLAIASRGHAQAPERATFYMLQRGDTIFVEPYSRTAARVDGELVMTAAGGMRRTYTFDLAPDGGVTRTTISLYRASTDTAPAEHAALRLAGDTMVVELQRGTQRIPTSAGAMSWINPSSVIVEQVLMHAKARG